MEPFPKNVNVEQRMRVVGITRVVLKGVLGLEDVHDLDISSWVVTDGKDVASVEDWLGAFDGKDVEITITLRDDSDDGVSVRRYDIGRT